MKKSLVALAVAAALPAFAQAQTSIQLTGSVDVAVESLNKEASGTGKSDLQINDGIWGGSRVGIVGTEELGSGLKALFNLEYRARADNGRLANEDGSYWKTSYVGLSGGFGTVLLGRMDTPMDEVVKMGDQTDGSWYYSADGLAGIIDNTSNTVAYQTPSLGGLKVTAAYVAGEATEPAGNDKLNKLGDAYSIGATGDWGIFTFGVGYQSIDGAKINNVKRTQQIAASIGTKLGDFGAGLGYGQSQVKAETGSNPAKNKAYYASFSYAVSDAGTVYLNYLRSEKPNQTSQLLKDKENGLGLTYAHGLSKRTYVYGTVGIGKAEVPGQDNTKPRRVALGVRHFF